MSSYDTNDPKGWCGDPSRGAALGRCTIKGEAKAVTVQRSFLDRGGYDRNGTYFGFGAALFWVSDENGEVDFMERAMDAEDLAKVLRDTYQTVTVGEPLSMPCWGHGEDTCPDNADADNAYGDQCEECYSLEREGEDGS